MASVCQATDMSSTNALGYLLKAAQAALHTRMEEALRPLGLGVSQYICLHLLADRPGISAAELAREAFVTRQSMNALLQTLVERGLVARSEASTGRALPAELTGAGRDALRRSERVVDDVEARMLAPLTENDRSDLRRSLLACVGALS